MYLLCIYTMVKGMSRGLARCFFPDKFSENQKEPK
jgi:hypothetical protein